MSPGMGIIAVTGGEANEKRAGSLIVIGGYDRFILAKN